MKTGFWLKGGKGKLAGATVYQQNGETVMREVVSPSNPQTEGQMIQRIIMLTVMKAYSKMKDICDHSFEGVKKGQPTMATFMSLNAGLLRNNLQQAGEEFTEVGNFTPLGQRFMVANAYQVSRGSLPQIDCVLLTAAQSESTVSSKVKVAEVVQNTYQGVCDALGLQRGDQLTFLTVTGRGSQQVDPVFKYTRIILDPTNPDGSQAAMTSAFVAEGAINLPSVRNEGTFAFISVTAEGGLVFSHDVTKKVYGAGIIASRKQGENWLRSNCFLASTPTGDGGYIMGDCLAMLESNNGMYIPNAQYLNNAGQGTGSGTNSNSGGGTTPPDDGPDNQPTDGD
jgi:hypothetical protein